MTETEPQRGGAVTTPQEMTVEQIRARLNEIAPAGEPVTAIGYARAQAVEAQIAWARMMDISQHTTMKDIAIIQGCFGTAHALLALAEAAPAKADEVAAQIADAHQDGGSAGEWIYEFHGEHAEEVVKLADQMAALFAAPKSTGWHESATALRKELVAESQSHHKATERSRPLAYAEDAPMVARDAYVGNLMARSYGYTLAAVLGEAAKYGPEVQQHLAAVADEILTDGDGEDRNADVMPAEDEGFPPPEHASELNSPAVLDMDCRGGNHAGCVGPPGTVCECRCHASPSADHTATLTTTHAARQGDPGED